MVARVPSPLPRLDVAALDARARLAGFAAACAWASTEEWTRETLNAALARRRGAGWSFAPSVWTLLLAAVFVGM